jgi:hypothetical protein
VLSQEPASSRAVSYAGFVERKLWGAKSGVPTGKPESGVVRQDGEMGCGVACVAAAVGTTYARALRFFAALRGDDQAAGYTRRALLHALGRAGRRYQFHTFGCRREARRGLAAQLPAGTIVFVRDETYSHGHYFLRRNDGWMDPLRDSPRRRQRRSVYSS